MPMSRASASRTRTARVDVGAKTPEHGCMAPPPDGTGSLPHLGHHGFVHLHQSRDARVVRRYRLFELCL